MDMLWGRYVDALRETVAEMDDLAQWTARMTAGVRRPRRTRKRRDVKRPQTSQLARLGWVMCTLGEVRKRCPTLRR